MIAGCRLPLCIYVKVFVILHYLHPLAGHFEVQELQIHLCKSKT